MTRDAMPSDHRLAQHNLGYLCLNERREKPANVPDAVWNDFERCRKNYNRLLSESRLPEDTAGRRTFLELGVAMRETSETLDTALAKIREFEPAFMPDPDFKQVQSALSAKREALVYFAVTPVGAVSFIVRLEDEPVSLIWLDDLTEETLSEKTQDYLRAYAEWRTNPEDLKIRATWFDVFDATGKLALDRRHGAAHGRTC